MPCRCCVSVCRRQTSDGVRLFRFPKVNGRFKKAVQIKQMERRNIWLQKTNIKECDLAQHYRVCSRHFPSGRPCKNDMDNSHPDWAPTLHIRNSMADSLVKVNMDRYSRRCEREVKRKCEPLRVVKNNENTDANVEDKEKDAPCEVINYEFDLYDVNQILVKQERDDLEKEEMSEETIDIEEKMDIHNTFKNDQEKANKVHQMLELVTKERNDLLVYTEKLLKLNEQLTASVVSLNQQLHDLKVQGKCQLLSEIENDGKKCKFYTGLNSFKLFIFIFNSLKPALTHDVRFTLKLEEQFLITLMKLRLNLSRKDLAYRFNVTHTTITSYIAKFVNVMFIRLFGSRCFIALPDKEAVIFRVKLNNIVWKVSIIKFRCTPAHNSSKF